MPIDFFTRRLFPRQADWQRRKQIKTMIYVIAISLVIGSALAGFILYEAYKR
jgi:hypothetical protein